MLSHTLTPEQTHALFDILTHYETYYEIESLKFPDAASRFGPPFANKKLSNGGDKDALEEESDLPILQLITDRFLLSFPWMKNLPPDFWTVRMQGLMESFGEADLSESYDKGVMGTRKTLATAGSSIVESIARGVLGGCPQSQSNGVTAAKEYDPTNATDLSRAFEDYLQDMVYGSLFDELHELLAKTEDIESHSPRVAAAVDYILIQYVFRVNRY
jgi:hypothetical protein